MSQAVKSINPDESNSCKESPESILNKALAPLGLTVVPFEECEKVMQAESKPVKYVATKGDEREEFTCWTEFCQWGADVADEVLYEMYLNSEADGRSGFEYSEWIYESDSYGPVVIEALEHLDWKVEELK